MRFHNSLLAFAVVPALALAGADPLPPAPPVEALVAQALERAPSLAAARERISAAAAVVEAVAVLPDPMLEVMIDNVGPTPWTVGEQEMSMVGVSYLQPLLYPGKRDARRASAAAEVVVREADFAALQRRLALEVRRNYAALYRLDREVVALAAARELLDLLAATVSARYAVGEVDQGAVLKAQLQQSRLAERLDDLAAERAGLVAGLNALRDLPGDQPLGVVAALPHVEPPPQPWDEAVTAGAPGIAVLRHEVAAAERQVDLARVEVKPNLLAGAGVSYRGDFDPLVSLRFGIELPVRRDAHQRARLAAAERDAERLRAELRAAEADARGAAARLAAEWRQAGNQIGRYDQAILPQTSAAVDAARASYLAGRGDFSTVLEDFRSWLDARVQLARREADRFVVWAELEALLPEPAADPAQEVNS
jgi:cobalt-zinc-cadmium efflux system outer membrane protein